MVKVDDFELANGVYVSRETHESLELYAGILKRWQTKINLVSPSSLSELWIRHFADSAQVLAFAPKAKTWVDFGTGAGFPGIVLALQLRSLGGAVHLVEINAKKCAFLREVIRATGAPAFVHHCRIEDIVDDLEVEVVTARALTSIERLLKLSDPLLTKGAVGVFLRGKSLANELTSPALSDRFLMECYPSKTESTGNIVVVRVR